MNKKVFLTGATGFLGSYIARYLVKRGYGVIALKRENSQMDLVADVEADIKWKIGDVNDVFLIERLVSDVDVVIHCAAMVSFNPKDKVEMKRTNIGGTETIVNACLFHNVDKLIYISSIAAIGRSKKGEEVTENEKWELREDTSVYSFTKYLAELEVWRGIYEGLDVSILNPSVILGAGFPGVGTMPLIEIIANRFKFYSQGTNGYVDVRDVAKSAVNMIEIGISKKRFIMNGINISYKGLFDKIAEKLQVPSPKYKVTPFLAELAWRTEKIKSLLTRRDPFLTKETARHSLKSYAYSNRESIAKLGVNYTPFDKTIGDTIKAYNLYRSENRIVPMELN